MEHKNTPILQQPAACEVTKLFLVDDGSVSRSEYKRFLSRYFII